MRHLQDQELIGLVFDELPPEERQTCKEHVDTCQNCQGALAALDRAVSVLEKAPSEIPPPFAWSRLRARIGQSGAHRDWSEPAWIPLILGQAAGIALVLVFIFLAGGWLETTRVWQMLRAWPLAAGVGPRGLAALVFFGAGALVTLALTPIFWWESRHPRNGMVK